MPLLKNLILNRYTVAGSPLPTLAQAKALAPELAKAAQAVYDGWNLDDDGYHWEVGKGGICHLIADQMVNVLDKLKTDVSTVSSSHEVHVYAVAKLAEGVVMIDIPYSLYETGGGYSWKKIPDVTFDKSDVVFKVLDGDPEAFSEYVEEF